MVEIAVRLEEWRAAERRRDALPSGSPEWTAADEAVRRAQAAYRGEASQAEGSHTDVDVVIHDRTWRPFGGVGFQGGRCDQRARVADGIR